MQESKKLTRRDFLKVLGAAGTASAVSVAAFPEIEEAQLAADKSRPSALRGRPFYIKQVDEITLGQGELRDDYTRFDFGNTAQRDLMRYLGEDEFDRLMGLAKQNMMGFLQDKKPGWSIRDRALFHGSRLITKLAQTVGSEEPGILQWNSTPWTEGLRSMGVKYEESPETAARDVRAAARHFGAALIGICELDRRMVFSTGGEYGPALRPIVFEDVDVPYTNPEKMVIPSSFKWAISLAHAESAEAVYRTPSAIGEAAFMMGYSQMSYTAGSLAEFIRSLGYEAIPIKNDIVNSVWIGAAAGLGEIGRTTRLITPEYGPMVRLSTVLTNLPLAVDKPIDAGIAEFCKSCLKCAEVCPTGCISTEPEPVWEKTDEFQASGHKAWFGNDAVCMGFWRENTVACGQCIAVCPWSKKDKAWIHGLVKVNAAVTPLFNGFLRRMDDAFYPPKNDPESQEAWWDLDLPPYGYDTMQFADKV